MSGGDAATPLEMAGTLCYPAVVPAVELLRGRGEGNQCPGEGIAGWGIGDPLSRSGSGDLPGRRPGTDMHLERVLFTPTIPCIVSKIFSSSPGAPDSLHPWFFAMTHSPHWRCTPLFYPESPRNHGTRLNVVGALILVFGEVSLHPRRFCGADENNLSSYVRCEHRRTDTPSSPLTTTASRFSSQGTRSSSL